MGIFGRFKLVIYFERIILATMYIKNTGDQERRPTKRPK